MLFCVLVRYRLKEFDKYALEAGFEYVKEDLEQFVNYEDLQEGERRLRWYCLLEHLNSYSLKNVLKNIPADMT